MAEIRAFRGYTYSPVLAGDLSSVIAPPWDVIDADKEEELFTISPYNIIRLISGDADPVIVKEVFDRWIKEGILQRDEKDSFYFCRHKYAWAGKNFTRTGIFTLLRLEDLGNNVIPHEKVFEKYHTNRYKLIEKCRANFSPVFMLYEDTEKIIEEIIDVTSLSAEGTIGEDSFDFGRINDISEISKIKALFSGKKLIIADGHHRYQGALRYYKDNPDPANELVLIFLVNIESPELLILPTHRYLPSCPSFANNRALFEKYFYVEEVFTKESMSKGLLDKKNTRTFGIYEEGKFYVIRLKSIDVLKEITDEGASDLWLSLDTVILHNLILAHILKVKSEKILYHQSTEYILDEYKKEGRGVAFFLNPVDKHEFVDICINGELMPQKSTYFYPKVPSGLVINKF